MTKYVLNSGGLRNNTEGARAFFAEVLKGLNDHPKILMCFFAEKRELWEEKFPTYIDGFKQWIPSGCEPTFTLAFPEDFEDQIKESDILYIHGGDDHLLRYWLDKFDIPKIWQGKVIATNSASTHIVSQSFWTCDWRKLMEGYGVLPIKTIAHYDSSYGNEDPRGPIDWQAAKKELEEYGNKNTPVYALKEGEFKVFEVEES